MTSPRRKLGKAIDALIWIAALGVLVENVIPFRQNGSLQEAVAPQITPGTQLQMLSGLTLDGRIVPVSFPALGSKLLILTFSPGCPACQANQAKWISLASTLGQKGGKEYLVTRTYKDNLRDLAQLWVGSERRLANREPGHRNEFP